MHGIMFGRHHTLIDWKSKQQQLGVAYDPFYSSMISSTKAYYSVSWNNLIIFLLRYDEHNLQSQRPRMPKNRLEPYFAQLRWHTILYNKHVFATVHRET